MSDGLNIEIHSIHVEAPLDERSETVFRSLAQLVQKHNALASVRFVPPEYEKMKSSRIFRGVAQDGEHELSELPPGFVSRNHAIDFALANGIEAPHMIRTMNALGRAQSISGLPENIEIYDLSLNALSTQHNLSELKRLSELGVVALSKIQGIGIKSIEIIERYAASYQAEPANEEVATE